MIDALLALAGLLIGGSACFNHLKAQKAKNWPTTTGKILSSSVGEGGWARRPEIRYEYQVNGESHIGDVRQFGVFHGFQGEKAQKAAEEYQPGKDVTVFFNPDNPGQAVLEPGQSNLAEACLAAVQLLTLSD